MFQSIFVSFLNFFDVSNIVKIFSIFIIEFLIIIFMSNCFNINVFYEYVSLYSVLYYIHISIFLVSLSKILTAILYISINDIVRGIGSIII